jgi:hypothetical protein
MTRASMVQRLLASAEDLLKLKKNSAAYRRRAVSGAYYAVFHALAGICTRTLLPNERGNFELERVYRALEHGNTYQAFGQPLLKDHPDIKQIAPIFRQLRDARERADYLPPDSTLFPEGEVVELINQARHAIQLIENLNSESRRLLAVRLLIKDRKS